MIKVLKYFKKSLGSVVIILLLLVVQAVCDLSLPQYTSNIVNVGIQQGGIANAAPDAIRKSELERMKLFLSQEDQKKLEEGYALKEKASLSQDDYEKLQKKYPVLENEAVYVRNNKMDGAQLDELNLIAARSLVMVSSIESNSDEVKAAKQQMIKMLPAQMQGQEIDLFALLANLPEAQRGAFLAQINEKINAMPESIIEQTAVAYVKQEYKALGMDTDKVQNNYILATGLQMLGFALGIMVCTILVTFLASRVSAQGSRDLRKAVFGKVVHFSNAEFDKYSTASLITRSTNDIQQIQMLVVMLLRVVLYAPIIGVGGVIKVLNTNTSMTWIIGLAVAIMLMLVFILFQVVMPKFKQMQKLIDKLNLVTREILTGLPVIRAFSTQKHERKRFDNANRDLMKTNLFVNRVMTCMMPAMMLIMNLTAVLIVWFGGHSIDDGKMQVGDMMAFIQYTMQIIMAFLMISMVSIMLPRAAVSANRVAEVLDTQSAVLDPEEPKQPLAEKRGLVEFRNVSFRYPHAEEDVLSGLNFIAEPGKTTAIIGSTGCGKSTLINLIPRFYDATQGEVLVDGVNVKDLSQHELRSKLGFVPQKGVLFSGTIESNIKYGDIEVPDEMMQTAAQVAQATEFIDEKPEQYESPIAQGGTNVSGGQKQRLSIARAIAKQPEIYIFDDSFSALDFKTDVALRRALKDQTGDSTVLIVAQRISTIMHAEQILVLDEGKIVGKGTHRELLKNCEVYQQIALSQLSKEELEHE